MDAGLGILPDDGAFWLEGAFFPPWACARAADVIRGEIRVHYSEPGKPAPPEGLVALLRLLNQGAARGKAARERRLRDLVASGHADVRASTALAASDPEPETVSTKDAAVIARRCERQLRRLAADGAIEAHRDQGAWRFHVGSLVAWAASRDREESTRKAA